MPTSNQTSKDTLSLAEEIRLQIQTHGPMSLATYMSLCLTHPTKGYYKKSNPLGEKGDFVTAPEISQMYGEMLGLWAHGYWQMLGSPEQFDLVELGPGRGTLMADAIRVISKDPKAMAALNIVLLETNPVLKDQQNDALDELAPVWIEEIDQLAARPNPKIIIANEFFDALPIRHFQFDKGQWHERVVGALEDKLAWGLSPTPMPVSTIPLHIDQPEDGEIWETCPLAHKTIEQIGRVLNQNGGAMILVDYGYETSQTGDTFQAIQSHEFADPLQAPGDADLTAHVDFEALINAAREVGSRAHFGGSQRQILKELGIEQRAQTLGKTNPQQAQSINADLERLIGKDQMGDLFKVMFIFGAPKPPVEQDQSIAEHGTISHGFFGRKGGESSEPFASLNVSKSMGDYPVSVLNNRATACASLGISPNKLAILKQVHSANIITIDESFDFASSPEADGMVTKTQNIGLGILTADCTPILFADPEAGIIGACHAGWQGAVDAIITNTIDAMAKLGADPKRILAAFGPTIWLENYEVGPQWASDFLTKHPTKNRFIVKTGKNNTEHFDLPGFIRAELENSQVGHISQVGSCTYENPKQYFSHRYATHKTEKTGRQIAIISLKQA